MRTADWNMTDPTPEEIVPGLFLVRDTCNVYVIVAENGDAITIDFGSGLVLRMLETMGATGLTHVLVTHAHRDQVQGLALLPSTVTVVVADTEIEYIVAAEQHWARQTPLNDYVLREQRFVPLRSFTGVVEKALEYREVEIGAMRVLTVPTPGHTVGSVSYRVVVGDHRCVFSGDLIAAPGKVPSLAALQWNYVGVEGAESALLSAANLLDEEPDVLLPSHGDPMHDPAQALQLLQRDRKSVV